MTDRPTNAPAPNPRLKPILIGAGVLDLALAAFFLMLGRDVLQLDGQTTLVVAAVLGAGGLSMIAFAVLWLGRRGPEERQRSDPVIRR